MSCSPFSVAEKWLRGARVILVPSPALFFAGSRQLLLPLAARGRAPISGNPEMKGKYWVRATCEDCDFKIEGKLHHITQFPNHCPKHPDKPFVVKVVVKPEHYDSLVDQLHNED